MLMMNNKKSARAVSSLLLLGCSLNFIFSSALAQSQAAADAFMTAQVLPSLGISKNQDLNFGSATPGAKAKELSPKNAGEAARFQLKGMSGAAYLINLPADGTVFLRHASGRSIPLNRFQSFPKFSGVLESDGVQFLNVGATRSSIDARAPLGNYTGSFTVTVTYQ